MKLLDALDVAGAVDDLGTDATLDDGTSFRGIFRSDYQSDNLTDVKIDGTRSSLIVTAETIASLAIKKSTGITVEGRAFQVRRVEPATSGFSRIVMAAR